MTMTIHGSVSKGYERVRDAFEANFREGGEVGAAFCLHVKSRKVVDLWGGTVDVGGKTWKENTPALVFSTTKGATAICAMMLVQQKRLDVDAPVATYWPEFAANGKAHITVRMVLDHQAGLPVVDANLSRAEVLAVGPVVDALARQAPVWEPGSKHGYHALTYGWLVGELVRRITGKTIGTFFKEEVATPLGLDFWIGLPVEEEPRVARLIAAPPPTDPAILAQMAAFFGPDSLAGRALSLNGAMASAPGQSLFNLPEVHRSEIPAANGITTARSLSRLYAACIGTVKGTRLFGKRTLDKALAIQSDGPDAVLGLRTTFGLGFMRTGPEIQMLGPNSFGHAGAGGSLGFGDFDAGVGFGYVMNQMGSGLLIDPRAARLIGAIRECLG
jgi:CubicO group peptidase (beta-lactamase class C family)